MGPSHTPAGVREKSWPGAHPKQGGAHRGLLHGLVAIAVVCCGGALVAVRSAITDPLPLRIASPAGLRPFSIVWVGLLLVCSLSVFLDIRGRAGWASGASRARIFLAEIGGLRGAG